MKTYLFDTINRFKRFSKQLDAKTIICDKAWQVFNDSGEKELYIFNTDGTVLITLNGVVTHGTWQFIAANDSLIITAASQSYMVHPAFLDDCLFALQVDGTDQVAFLIDQKNSQSFAPKTYQQVIDYFAGKEKQEKKQIELKRKQEAEELRRKAEQDKLKREREWENSCNALIYKLEPSLLLIFVYIIIGFALSYSLPFLFENNVLSACIMFVGLTVTIVIAIIEYNYCSPKRHKKNIQKYIEEHPDDPRNAYLKEYMEKKL